MKELNKILEDMKMETENGDKEIAHINADGLLIDLIEYLKDNTLMEDSKKVVIDNIIEEYADVSKWYA